MKFLCITLACSSLGANLLNLTFGKFFFSCLNRDIRGANLLVDSSGVVKFADFGMAKHVSLLSSSSSLLYHFVF